MTKIVMVFNVKLVVIRRSKTGERRLRRVQGPKEEVKMAWSKEIIERTVIISCICIVFSSL